MPNNKCFGVSPKQQTLSGDSHGKSNPIERGLRLGDPGWEVDLGLEFVQRGLA